MYYVYTLSHPITGEVAYVGLTCDPLQRFKQHLQQSKPGERRQEWIDKLKADNLPPSFKILETLVTLDEAETREQYWIKFYLDQGVPLCNMAVNFKPAEPVNREVRQVRPKYWWVT